MDRAFGLMVGFIFVIALAVFVTRMILSFTVNITLTSPTPIKPIVKVNCIEVDGSKECDTTYTYKK